MTMSEQNDWVYFKDMEKYEFIFKKSDVYAIKRTDDDTSVYIRCSHKDDTFQIALPFATIVKRIYGIEHYKKLILKNEMEKI